MANGTTQEGHHPLAFIPFVLNISMVITAMCFAVLGTAGILMLIRGLPGWWHGLVRYVYY